MRAKIFSLVLCVGLAGTLTACGSVRHEMSELRTSLAQNWGMKKKKNFIKHKHLGKNYSALRGTSFDFLGKTAPKNRRLNIYYHSYGLDSVDDFNRNASILFAKFQYTEGLVDMLLIDAKHMVKHDIRRMSLRAINKTLRARKVKKTKRQSVNDYRKIRDDFKRLLRGYKRVANDAKKLYKAGIKMLKNAPKEFRKDPRKAIYADKMIVEIKDSIKRLSGILKGSHGLSKRIGQVSKFARALDAHHRR
jgi:hypothetical protein